MTETNVATVNVAAGPNKHINPSGKGPETRQQLSLNNYSSLLLDSRNSNSQHKKKQLNLI